MSDIVALNFEGANCRVIHRQDGPWWVAKDVCGVLGLATDRSVRELDDDERGRHSMPTPGGPQEMAIISEPGLYALVARSRKPVAKRFDRWVRHDVLPAIRKDGGYSLHGDSNELLSRIVAVAEQNQATMLMLSERSIHHERKLDRVCDDVTELKGQVANIHDMLPRIRPIPKVIRDWVIEMARKMGGQDPLDPTKSLFDGSGRFIGQIDHFDGKRNNNVRGNLWPLHPDVHKLKTGGQYFSKAELDAAFESWHAKAKRLEPEQGAFKFS